MSEFVSLFGGWLLVGLALLVAATLVVRCIRSSRRQRSETVVRPAEVATSRHDVGSVTMLAREAALTADTEDDDGGPYENIECPMCYRHRVTSITTADVPEVSSGYYEVNDMRYALVNRTTYYCHACGHSW